MFHLTVQLQVCSSRRGVATMQLLRFEQGACFRYEVVDLWCQSCVKSVIAFPRPRGGRGQAFLHFACSLNRVPGHDSAPRRSTAR